MYSLLTICNLLKYHIVLQFVYVWSFALIPFVILFRHINDYASEYTDPFNTHRALGNPAVYYFKLFYL